jgi:hypothetical protein
MKRDVLPGDADVAATDSPSRIRRDATHLAVLLAMAKQMPCAGRMTAVLTPITSPRELTSGPPELPGFKAASVWIRLSISRPVAARSERPSELTTPAVTDAWKPYGLPMAIAIWPTFSFDESPNCAMSDPTRDAYHCEVGIRIIAKQPRGNVRPSASATLISSAP